MELEISKRYVLVIGATAITSKKFYYKPLLEEMNLEYLVYTSDQSEECAQICQCFNAKLFRGPKPSRSLLRVLKEGLHLLRILKTHPVAYADFYVAYYPGPLLLLLYGILNLFKIPVVCWFIGELFEYEETASLKKFAIKQIAAGARLLVLKELYMEEVMRKERIGDRTPRIFLPNAVHIPDLRSRGHDERFHVLFLNMFKKWRHAEFLIDVAEELSRMDSNIELFLVGDKSSVGVLSDTTEELKKKMGQAGNGARVSIHPWTANAEAWYRECHVFVLPAKLVFCNYALLEAMSYGLVPIISDEDKNGSKIVSHEVDGYILPLDPRKWAETIYRLRRDARLFREISARAREKIERAYSVISRVEELKRGLLQQGILSS